MAPGGRRALPPERARNGSTRRYSGADGAAGTLASYANEDPDYSDSKKS